MLKDVRVARATPQQPRAICRLLLPAQAKGRMTGATTPRTPRSGRTFSPMRLARRLWCKAARQEGCTHKSQRFRHGFSRSTFRQSLSTFWFSFTCRGRRLRNLTRSSRRLKYHCAFLLHAGCVALSCGRFSRFAPPAARCASRLRRSRLRTSVRVG